VVAPAMVCHMYDNPRAAPRIPIHFPLCGRLLSTFRSSHSPLPCITCPAVTRHPLYYFCRNCHWMPLLQDTHITFSVQDVLVRAGAIGAGVHVLSVTPAGLDGNRGLVGSMSRLTGVQDGLLLRLPSLHSQPTPWCGSGWSYRSARVRLNNQSYDGLQCNTVSSHFCTVQQYLLYLCPSAPSCAGKLQYRSVLVRHSTL
jgi:hypothetical protein